MPLFELLQFFLAFFDRLWIAEVWHELIMSLMSWIGMRCADPPAHLARAMSRGPGESGACPEARNFLLLLGPHEPRETRLREELMT